MSTLTYILIYTFLGSLGSLIGGLILLSKEKLALKFSHLLSSLAAGVLLGTAFFDLLPEAHHAAEESGIDIFLWTLIGVLFFFIIERFIHWFHHHEEYGENNNSHSKESKTTLPLIIFADTMHNFIDGILIALTFMISIPLGIVTTFAVAAHEIPQEIGDFGLMLHKGLAKKKIILVNIFSGAAAFLGALLAYALGESIEAYIPIVLSITAGFFIYIATSDLIPEIHNERRKNFAVYETLLLVLGVVIVYVAISLLSNFHTH